MSKALNLFKKKNLLAKGNASKLPPTVKLDKVNLNKKTLENFIQNKPDIGNQFIEPYNKLEKTVQGIENVNEFVTNMAFGANALNYAAPSSRLATSTQSFTKLGKPANYVQAGLYAVDAARALVDPEYREKAQDGINKMFENSKGDFDLMTTALTYGSQRPLAFTAGLLRNAQNTRAEINRLEAEGKILSDRIEQQKLKQQSSITPKGAKNIGNTGLDFKNFMDTRNNQGLIFNQAQNYRNQIK